MILPVLTELQKAVNDKKEISFNYINYRGEKSRRRVFPLKLYEGQTEYHPERQWLLEARDCDKDEIRRFAIKDIKGGIE